MNKELYHNFLTWHILTNPTGRTMVLGNKEIFKELDIFPCCYQNQDYLLFKYSADKRYYLFWDDSILDRPCGYRFQSIILLKPVSKEMYTQVLIPMLSVIRNVVEFSKIKELEMKLLKMRKFNKDWIYSERKPMIYDLTENYE